MSPEKCEMQRIRMAVFKILNIIFSTFQSGQRFEINISNRFEITGMSIIDIFIEYLCL